MSDFLVQKPAECRDFELDNKSDKDIGIKTVYQTWRKGNASDLTGAQKQLDRHPIARPPLLVLEENLCPRVPLG